MSKKRPVFLIVTCVVQVVGSALVLLMSVGLLLAPSIVDRFHTPATAPPHALFYGTAAMNGSFAILGLLTAIGLFRVKSWARYSTLVFATLLVFTGLIMLPMFVFVPM